MVDGSHRSDFCTLRILSDLIASFCRTFSYSGSRSSRAGHTPDCRIRLVRSQFLYQTWIIIKTVLTRNGCALNLLWQIAHRKSSFIWSIGGCTSLRTSKPSLCWDLPRKLWWISCRFATTRFARFAMKLGLKIAWLWPDLTSVEAAEYILLISWSS